ncbi:hypothetical protein WJX73_005844 [Symbiochloris irregularis]|uniref:Protein kinase domain-containing protein n=1 Tax=Symbiochloris irregularis TaxID=706552 RepID=A0AAW1PQN6_9CHLO
MRFEASEMVWWGQITDQVGKATLLGHSAAVKWVDLLKQKPKEQALRTEARVYRHLPHTLQGTAIPKVLAIGCWVLINFIFVATLLYKQPASPRHFSQTQCEQAVEALRKIHDAGVLHGDVHSGNCLIDDQGAGRMLWAKQQGAKTLGGSPGFAEELCLMTALR